MKMVQQDSALLQLELFFKKVADDPRIGAVHISMYMAIFYKWYLSGSTSSVEIIRSEIMEAAKIKCNATYFKIMNDLADFNLIGYEPSFNPKLKCIVHLKVA